MSYLRIASLIAAAGSFAISHASFAKHPQKDSLTTTLDSLILKLSGQHLELPSASFSLLSNLDPNVIAQGLANIAPESKPRVTNEYYSDGHTRYFIANPMNVHLEGEVAAVPDGTRKTKDYYFDGVKRYYIENPKLGSTEQPAIIEGRIK
jgi:hypothetical protein